jgi:hypothetical protein
MCLTKNKQGNIHSTVSKRSFLARRSRRYLSGTSLVEFVMAAGVGSLVFLAVIPLTIYSGWSFASLANYSDMNMSVLNTLDRVTMEIREASRLVSYSSNEITLDMGTNKPTLSYVYSPVTRTLTRQQGGESKVMMRGVDSLDFSMFKRNPKPGTFEHYGTTNVNDCRVLTVKWNCSRRLMGARVTSESVEAARILLRKR